MFDPDAKCGCGKEAIYATQNGPACNKHLRCVDKDEVACANDAIDVRIAKLILKPEELKLCNISHNGVKSVYVRCFSPTSVADDDYRVLEYVRENWNTKQIDCLAEKLSDIWIVRHFGKPMGMDMASCYFATAYIPGDYARSALAVMEEGE